ncbi:hypothetical protein ElyMa_002834800 [Elysia marginata]|uniref:Uncharacterized protein n=1 Tax=Elysia marginata TaxID=1093978 RepID=A0AAV4HT32_9GAST|nr:hypothetical protein ElyMa_002834800 [Elysia marginata]
MKLLSIFAACFVLVLVAASVAQANAIDYLDVQSRDAGPPPSKAVVKRSWWRRKRKQLKKKLGRFFKTVGVATTAAVVLG